MAGRVVVITGAFGVLGQAVAKERLFDQVFAGEADVQPDAIEVVAYRLRKKLATTGVKLVTLRGLGYLVAPQ